MLYLELFGGFGLQDVNGRPIHIELAKPRALLAYLALNPGREIDRMRLATLIWGSQDTTRARHSLTQALSTLARSLGEGADGLQRGRQQVCLQADCISVDAGRLLRIDETSKPRDLLAAVQTFDPDLLAEFSFDEPAFDEWALMTREAVQEQAMRAGIAYLSLDETMRDGVSSLAVARKLLQLDPFCEPAHRALIREYLAGGDSAAAKKQARTCQQVLRDDLGVEPGPETRRIIDTIPSVESAKTGEPAAIDALPEDSLNTNPSVVVLALQNLTGDPALDHVCQGISDDITTELVRYRSLFVISRESAFQFTGSPENTDSLCRRLGVRHALCGSLRPYRGKLRINIRLVESVSGRSSWSEKYDIDKSEILEIADDVIENLVSRLALSLEEAALARARRRPPADWSAYDHLLQGLVYHHRSWYGTGMLFGAIKHFTRAVELDPELARAHAYLACAISAPFYTEREIGSLDRCIDHAARAIEIDPFEAEGQRIMGGVQLVRGDHDLAEHHFDLALRAHPGNAHVLAHAAKHRTYVGDHLDAVSLVNKARQLNPLHPAWYWQHLGVALFDQQEYEQAIRMFGRMPLLVFFDRLYLAAAYANLGDRKTAAHHLGIALRDKPDLGRNTIDRFLPYQHAEELAKVTEGLAIAGLD
jgi:DNA-binding SARP family transcriptional activator